MTICLIGFMGSGKTTIGRALRDALGRDWVDLDHYIEMQTQKRISDIFAEKGESYFRSLEQKYLKQLIDKGTGIISTGGGVITMPENIALLQKTHSVYLEYPFEILYERIAGDRNRPLATSYEALYKRFNERLDLYEKARKVKIDCKGKDISQIIQEIINNL